MRVPPFPPVAAILEDQTLTIDFGPRLPAGVTLTGTPTVTLNVLYGTDPAPQSRISGGPTVGTAPPPNGSGIALGAVLFQVADCQPGVLYGVICNCPTTAGDNPVADTSFTCYAPE